MESYHTLLRHILDNGTDKGDRTGTGTRSVFGYQWRHDLATGFPLLTTKRVHFKSVAYELLWFLKGGTNTAYLKQHGVSIWDEWADADGNLGPVYGKQWRTWQAPSGETIDQLSMVIEELKRNPDSRRMVVSAWNAADLPAMALQPCHVMFQFYVANGKLSCHMYQRSADVFLGVPFNIASYALLTHMVAEVCDLGLGDLVISFGDVHLYNNHFEQAHTQLSRTPGPLPTLKIAGHPTSPKNIDTIDFEHFILEGYVHQGAIAAPVAV